MSNALDRLAAHGEAFMAMFEDDEVDATLEASSKKRQKVGETAFVPVGPRQQEPSAARNPGSREEPLKPASAPQGRALQGRPQSARAPKPDLPRIERQLEQSIAANEAQRQLLDKKRLLEMKAFMSSKACDVIQASVIGSKPFAPPNRKSPAKTPESDEAAFALIARDVEFLGAKRLQGKAFREWEARMLKKVGCKAPKNLKTPISILNGMRKKEGERVTAKREEDIAAGNLVLKKKKRGEYRPVREQGVLHIGKRMLKHVEATQRDSKPNMSAIRKFKNTSDQPKANKQRAKGKAKKRR